MNIPENLKYTKDHEWLKIDGDEAIVGITDFAQQELGDIVFVEVDTVDEMLEKEDTFGTIEAVKTVSDLFMPISGEVLEFNEILGGFSKIPYEVMAVFPVFILLIAFVINVVKPEGVLKLGMICYAGILSLMGFFTLMLLYTSPSFSSLLLFIGALIFMSSDAVLSLRIIKKIKGIPNSFIMMSYLSAQLLIVLGIIMKS